MTLSVNTLPIAEAKTAIPDHSALFCFASFESRTLVGPEALKDSISHAFIFKNIKLEESDINARIIEKQYKSSEIIDVTLDNPETTADLMAKAIDNLNGDIQSIIIDTTTFTHETLLILLKIIQNQKDRFEKIFCIYVGAGGYSTGDTPEQMWLSKGCKDVRNVIGYPGILRPIAKTNLMILAGFEIERATRLIELIEPDRLILGNGIDPVAENHTAAMSFFQNKFAAWQKEYKNIDIETFEFSCKNIEDTVSKIQCIISGRSEENFILVPLNTKLSTIAASLVAFSNPQIQLCYSIPETYNYSNYSIPGNNVTVVDLKSSNSFN